MFRFEELVLGKRLVAVIVHVSSHRDHQRRSLPFRCQASSAVHLTWTVNKLVTDKTNANASNIFNTSKAMDSSTTVNHDHL